jgi:hypothetical protein
MQLQTVIRRAIEIGLRRGFITFDQLNELCPDDIEPEQIEALFEALSEEGINVMDEPS